MRVQGLLFRIGLAVCAALSLCACDARSAVRENQDDGTTEHYPGDISSVRASVLTMIAPWNPQELDTLEPDKIFFWLRLSYVPYVIVASFPVYVGVWFTTAGEDEVAVRCVTRRYNPVGLASRLSESEFHAELRAFLNPAPRGPVLSGYSPGRR